MVDEALDALYAGPVETFIAERDRLAKERKAAGDKDGAALLKAQHKPTQVAHALNTLVRTERARIDTLLQVGRTLAGGKADFRAALEQQRALTQELTQKAAALAGADAHALMSVLQGAMASPELAAELLKARFSKLPEVPVGFFGAPPPVTAVTPAPVPAETPVQAPAPRPRPTLVPPDTRGQDEEKRVAEVRRAAHAAAVLAAQKLADEAQAEADSLGATAERAVKVAEAAKHAHTEAVTRAKLLAVEAHKLRDRRG